MTAWLEFGGKLVYTNTKNQIDKNCEDVQIFTNTPSFQTGQPAFFNGPSEQLTLASCFTHKYCCKPFFKTVRLLKIISITPTTVTIDEDFLCKQVPINCVTLESGENGMRHVSDDVAQKRDHMIPYQVGQNAKTK